MLKSHRFFSKMVVLMSLSCAPVQAVGPSFYEATTNPDSRASGVTLTAAHKREIVAQGNQLFLEVVRQSKPGENVVLSTLELLFFKSMIEAWRDHQGSDHIPPEVLKKLRDSEGGTTYEAILADGKITPAQKAGLEAYLKSITSNLHPVLGVGIDGDVLRDINQTVETKTQIKNFLKPEDLRDSSLVVVGTTKVELLWKTELEKTINDFFTLANGEKIEVPYAVGITDVYLSETEQGRILRLPLKDQWDNQQGTFSVFFNIPHDSKNIPEFSETWSQESDPEKINLHLPTYTLKSEKDFKKVLKEMGFPVDSPLSKLHPFLLNSEDRAKKKDVKLDRLKQVATLSTTGKGITASSATMAGVSKGIGGLAPDVKIDRPHAVVIAKKVRVDSQVFHIPIFQAWVPDPSQGKFEDPLFSDRPFLKKPWGIVHNEKKTGHSERGYLYFVKIDGKTYGDHNGILATHRLLGQESDFTPGSENHKALMHMLSFMETTGRTLNPEMLSSEINRVRKDGDTEGLREFIGYHQTDPKYYYYELDSQFNSTGENILLWSC